MSYGIGVQAYDYEDTVASLTADAFEKAQRELDRLEWESYYEPGV